MPVEVNGTVQQEALEKLNSEIRRGAIVLGVLGALQQEHYGYSLRKHLLEGGLAVEEGTLYPLIRRLEKQGLLTSTWREEDKRKKRFYQLSEDGAVVYAALFENWATLNNSIHTITQAGGRTLSTQGE